MQIFLLLSCLFATTVLGSPAKRACPQNQCFNGTNACGVAFGGCWDDCSLGINQRPTFIAPPCSSGVASLEPTALAPMITAPPAIISMENRLLPGATSTCFSGHTICIDYMQVCGNGTRMYGGCHDVCSTDKVYTAPICTVSTNTASHTSTTKSRKPATTRPACKNEKSFMCAPLGW